MLRLNVRNALFSNQPYSSSYPIVMRSTQSIFSSALLIFASIISNVSTSECTFKQEADVIKCAFALVEQIDIEHINVHPAFSEISTLCNSFSTYNSCVAKIHPQCRRSMMTHIERIYNIVCEKPFREKFISQRYCLKALESNAVKIKECISNHGAMFDEQFTLLQSSNNSTNNQCIVLQNYIDCAFTGVYKEQCADAIK
uniref:DUF19 domain-containing protein n=1 Tax=Parascaris univalens TaxID=6257 RepID=A0A915CBS4_PARUN